MCVHTGVVFVASSTAHKHQQHNASASTTVDTGLEPFLAPTTSCQLDAQLQGPPQQLAVPLSYHVWLNLSDTALYRPGDATGRVAAGFAGRVNITMHVEQVRGVGSWQRAPAGRHVSASPSCLSLTMSQPHHQHVLSQPGSTISTSWLTLAAMLTDPGMPVLRAPPLPLPTTSRMHPA